MSTSTTGSSHPIKVFCSYSHKDKELCGELKAHLSALTQEDRIELWTDMEIRLGSEWKPEILRALEEADLILLLVSADFIDSKFCYHVEMKRAIARHEAKNARVIPIILRAVDWGGTPMERLQALPEDATPITSWSNQDEAWTNVAVGIRKAVDELESRHVQQLDRAATAEKFPSIWNIPYRRNLHFTGRESLLESLHTVLNSESGVAITQPQAIHGLGGIGKTQLAVEYAYRHATEYETVWWVRSEETSTLITDYAGFARELDLPEKDAQDQTLIVKAVRHWLEQNPGWLLILDNVENPQDIHDFLPPRHTGHILITSRYPNWSGITDSLSVDTMERDESVQFLLARTSDTDHDAANNLADALGDLPLALEQAAAYIESTGIALNAYLERFNERHDELLQSKDPSTDYPEPVAATWDLSIQKVQDDCPNAVELLRLLSFLAPDDIPRDLIASAPKHLPKPLAETVSDPLEYDQAVRALRGYALIGTQGGMFSIHRLVQMVIRDRLTGDEKKDWSEATVSLLDDAFPFEEDNVDSWNACDPLLTHALTAADHAERFQTASGTTGHLLNDIGRYLKIRARYTESKDTHKRAVLLCETAYGKDHSKTASAVNNLGTVLKESGDFAGARECFERALAIGEETLGKDHPIIAIRVNNLGMVLKDLGDLAGARERCKRALAIVEKEHGPKHPDVARAVNNLGRILQDLGELKHSLDCHERALAIGEAEYGKEHPQVAIYVNNCGLALRALGDLANARKCYKRALAIDEEVYGPKHPHVARDLNNLGGVLKDLGEPADALECYERALVIYEKTLGENHPNVATLVNNLGSVLQDLGDLKGARNRYARALSILKEFLGVDHPHTKTTQGNLDNLLSQMKNQPGE